MVFSGYLLFPRQKSQTRLSNWTELNWRRYCKVIHKGVQRKLSPLFYYFLWAIKTNSSSLSYLFILLVIAAGVTEQRIPLSELLLAWNCLIALWKEIAGRIFRYWYLFVRESTVIHRGFLTGQFCREIHPPGICTFLFSDVWLHPDSQEGPGIFDHLLLQTCPAPIWGHYGHWL